MGIWRAMADVSTVLFRDRVIHWVTESRIGLDYLSTRKEIDMNKLAWIPTSHMINGLIVPAVDNRINSIVLIACGIYPESKTSLPEVNPVNFVAIIINPHIFYMVNMMRQCLTIYLSFLSINC